MTSLYRPSTGAMLFIKTTNPFLEWTAAASFLTIRVWPCILEEVWRVNRELDVGGKTAVHIMLLPKVSH